MTSTVLTRFGSSLNSSTTWKAAVRCATTGPISLQGIQTIDGVVVSSTDQQNGLNIRCLVKAQTNPQQNGIYDMQTGAWVRSADFDGNEDIVSGTHVFVANGATQSGTWALTTPDPAQIVATFPSNITFAPAVTVDLNFGQLTASAEIDPNNDYFLFYDSEAAATEKINLAIVARNFADGTAAAPGMAFAADQGTGLYRPGASQLGISLGGALTALFTAAALTLGVAGTSLGALALSGSAGGVVTIKPQATAGTWNFNLPITAGTSGQVLTSAGGGSSPMTWSNVTVPTSANPSASVGLSAVNGTATTFMTSDSAPALSQAIAPTWTGLHTFSNSGGIVVGSATLAGPGTNILGLGGSTASFPALKRSTTELQARLADDSAFTSFQCSGIKLNVAAGSNGTIQAGNNLTIDASNAGEVSFNSQGGTGLVIIGGCSFALSPSQFFSNPNYLTGVGAATLQLGQADGASPVAQFFQVQNVVAGTTNTSGVNWTIIGSLSTGSGTSGDIIFQTGATGAGATSQNTATTALTIKGATQQVIMAVTPRISVAPTAVSGAGPIAIGSASTINSRIQLNMNGTTYWIPASTTAF